MDLELDLKLLQGMDQIVNVREYETESIKEDIIDQLLKAFSLGPSLANIQPWELVVLRNPEEKQNAVHASLDPFLTKDSFGAQQWIQDAPFVMVACIEKRRALARIGDEGEIFSIQDLFSAIQNFRLLAILKGLSTSVVREFDQLQLKENLNLPWYVEPHAIVTAGYSDAQLEIPPRFKVREIVHGGGWDEQGE
jgi:5,6-dimethylbenzimidazole synthase